IVIYTSPTSQGNYSSIIADESLVLRKKRYKKFFNRNFENRILIVNDTGNLTSELHYFRLKDNPKAVIILKDRLQWSLATNVSDYPFIEVVRVSASNVNRIEFSIENKFFSDYSSQNILGYIKGALYPDSFVVFSAHYDHLGQMGKDVYFPGANDNASGCAMILNLAKYYSQHSPKYSIAFMAFGAEEVGLLGSKYYVEHPLFPLRQIKFLVNMDIMGTGDEGIKVVNATEHKKEFDELVKINSEKNLLPSIQPRGKAQNSDHYFFEEAGVKTFFIYTLGGIKAYHDIYDRAETLPLTKFEEVFKLLCDFTDYLQN
ncbi:MAG: M20/M25/M40 family metallo-hydrolase, partial [Bacteroidota bacterium]